MLFRILYIQLYYNSKEFKEDFIQFDSNSNGYSENKHSKVFLFCNELKKNIMDLPSNEC